jgi:hypothetical protein
MDDATLWIDSDVARSVPKVRQLAELAQTKGVRVVVHAQVHLEQCRQVREDAARRGRPFAPERIQSFLDQLGIEVIEARIDRTTAEAWAELIHTRFPTETAWRQAKLSTVRARLPDGTTVTADRVPFTTDWHVALEVERRRGFVAVEDRGEEWRALREASPKRALSFTEAMAWLAAKADSGAPRA